MTNEAESMLSVLHVDKSVANVVNRGLCGIPLGATFKQIWDECLVKHPCATDQEVLALGTLVSAHLTQQIGFMVEMAFLEARKGNTDITVTTTVVADG